MGVPKINKDQDAKPWSLTPGVLQSPKSGFKGHGCSLHLQSQSYGKTWPHMVPKSKYQSVISLWHVWNFGENLSLFWHLEANIL